MFKRCYTRRNLSPFLFALYLNDLDTFVTSKNAQRVKSISEDFENDLQRSEYDKGRFWPNLRNCLYRYNIKHNH